MSAVRHRSALAATRRAAGYTQEGLAEALNVARSTVIRWEAGEHAPVPYLWPKLARLLGRSTDQLRALLDDARPEADSFGSDLDVALAWLDQHAGWSVGTSRRKVAAGLRKARPRRAEVGRSRVADRLARYYGRSAPGYGLYRASELETSVLTRPGWLDLAVPLTPEADRLVLATSASARTERLDAYAAESAVRRLVDVAASDVRMTNAPVYRLRNVDIGQDVIGGEVEALPFVDYALTVDLLERELVDALAEVDDSLPLRDKYLPDVDAVLDLAGRVCAGGVLSLCAIARPADPYRGPADYALLVQERSGQVVNAAGRLAVIPKGFHGPLSDHRADARIGATLRRELEEELFGRDDVDSTAGRLRVADPMHPARLSAPMRWLTERPGRLQTECTGFGFNLVSGNYEFACLTVVEDDEFWTRFGGDVEANWESSGLRQYSTLDGDRITDLLADESWSNEGLFALHLGLRRLRDIGGDRVAVPEVGWSLGG